VNNTIRTIMVWLVIGVILTMVFMQVGNRQSSQSSLDYSTFMDEAQAGHIARVKIDGTRTLKAVSRDGKNYTVFTPGIQDPWMVSDLRQWAVAVEAKPEEEPSLLMNIFVSWFPMLLLIGVWIFFMRQMQVGGGKAMSFVRSTMYHGDSSSGLAAILTCLSRSDLTRSGSFGAKVRKRSPLLYLP